MSSKFQIHARATSSVIGGSPHDRDDFGTVGPSVWDEVLGRLQSADVMSIFGESSTEALVARWCSGSVDPQTLRTHAAKLREMAFTVQHPGSIPVQGIEFEESPPGAFVVLAAIFEHLATLCGTDGVVSFKRATTEQ